MSFATHIRGVMPKALELPDEFAAVFDWAEALGQAGSFPSGEPFLSIYPNDQRDAPGASYLIFHFGEPPLAPPFPDEISQRYATIASAAGDGGTMGLWLDDAGDQKIVTFDHGWPYVLTDDPIKALQFLSIGYPEPAALPNARFTLAEAVADFGADPPIIPKAFQDFLIERFGVVVPKRASDLGMSVPVFEDMSDPMRQWMQRMLPN